jgi:hypothetical protein
LARPVEMMLVDQRNGLFKQPPSRFPGMGGRRQFTALVDFAVE